MSTRTATITFTLVCEEGELPRVDVDTDFARVTPPEAGLFLAVVEGLARKIHATTEANLDSIGQGETFRFGGSFGKEYVEFIDAKCIIITGDPKS